MWASFSCGHAVSTGLLSPVVSLAMMLKCHQASGRAGRVNLVGPSGTLHRWNSKQMPTGQISDIVLDDKNRRWSVG